VPVSLLSHSVIIAMFVVLPILAAPYMPGVLANRIEYVDIVIPPVPPAPRPRAEKPQPVENPNAAPFKAPDRIIPEPLVAIETVGNDPGVIGGDENIERVLTPLPVVAAPPQAQVPVPVGGKVRRPTKVGGADPIYPAIAQAARIQGIVIIEATIAADGHVMNARVLRSVVQMLDQAALDAVRTWEYTPSTLNGEPVPVIMTVTVTFTLSK